MFKKRIKQSACINTEEIKQGQNAEEPEQPEKDQTKKQYIEGSQPTKKVKLERKNVIGGSTKDRQQQADEAIHQKFQSLHYYNANKNDPEKTEKILTGQQAEKTQSQLAKQRYLEQVQTTKRIKEGKLSTKIYRGANNYANYKLTQADLEKPDETYKWKYGPTRSKTNNAQNTCRFDYDPSLCKDWHDSGYCVFGNSCLYLHDRSNYKTGWQLQKDFERAQRERWKRINNPDLAQQPNYLKQIQKFKANQICPHCNKQFKTPVETSCRHIFCLKCASELNDKKKKCPVCQKKLDGIMNNAQKTLKKQKEQYQQMKKMAEISNEVSLAKRSKYRDVNSIDVFTTNEHAS